MNVSIATTNGMSIEDWAKAARKSPYRQSYEQQRAIDTLQIVFEGKDGADSAATTIASLFNPLLQHGFSVSPVFEFWVSVCEAIRMLGANQRIDGRLIELLNALSNLPDLTDQSGKAIGPGGGFPGVYWKDLPGLGITFREFAIDIEPESPEMPDEGDWTAAQRATLMNVVTFGALYLVHGRTNIGMSSRAEVSMMHGLETSYRSPEQRRRAKTLVPPAATWILLAGKKIYELCKSGVPQRGRGYSLERWDLWKEDLFAIAGNTGLTVDVNHIAIQAAAKMGKVERQMQHNQS
ncbi:MAG: hypothetical protein Q9177_001186 [Variospora cf. flavescens]